VQAGAQQPLRAGEVHAAVVALLERGDHAPRVLQPAGPDRRDRLADRGLGLGLAHLGRQEALDHPDLLRLLLRHLEARALLAAPDLAPALVDHRRQHAADLLVADAAALPLAAARRLPRAEVPLLDRGQDQPQRARRPLVAGLVRVLERGIEPIAQHVPRLLGRPRSPTPLAAPRTSPAGVLARSSRLP
jgi:hypothetical protein